MIGSRILAVCSTVVVRLFGTRRGDPICDHATECGCFIPPLLIRTLPPQCLEMPAVHAIATDPNYSIDDVEICTDVLLEANTYTVLYFSVNPLAPLPPSKYTMLCDTRHLTLIASARRSPSIVWYISDARTEISTVGVANLCHPPPCSQIHS
jgi:hypothetical protein